MEMVSDDRLLLAFRLLTDVPYLLAMPSDGPLREVRRLDRDGQHLADAQLAGVADLVEARDGRGGYAVLVGDGA